MCLSQPDPKTFHKEMCQSLCHIFKHSRQSMSFSPFLEHAPPGASAKASVPAAPEASCKAVILGPLPLWQRRPWTHLCRSSASRISYIPLYLFFPLFGETPWGMLHKSSFFFFLGPHSPAGRRGHVGTVTSQLKFWCIIVHTPPGRTESQSPG